MSESNTGMSGSGTTREWTGGDGMRERAEDMADKAGHRFSEYSDKAVEQVEMGKDKAATGIEQAAGTIRDKVAGTSGITADAGTKVADTMDRTADYLHEHSTAEIWDEVEHFVREHPAKALAGAVFAGFLIARVLR
jgi:ElaB/YqjD/DUF883 family membrane-anchored ribosome-binding protein